MHQDDVNDKFREIAFRDTVDEMTARMTQMIHLEAKSRHEITCNDDIDAANVYANEAIALFLDLAVKDLPTFVMAIIDKLNREHECFTAFMDEMEIVRGHLRQAIGHSDKGDVQMTRANIGAAQIIIDQAFEDAPYEKIREDGQ